MGLIGIPGDVNAISHSCCECMDTICMKRFTVRVTFNFIPHEVKYALTSLPTRNFAANLKLYGVVFIIP